MSRAWDCCWPWLVVGLLLAPFGCSSGSSTSTPLPEPTSARELLDRVVATYNTAQSYADSGQFIASFVVSGEPRTETSDFSTTLERPSKLRLHAYQAMVVCDGKDFWASLSDLPGQVLRLRAPDVMTRVELYSDLVLREVITRNLGAEPLPLLLLMDTRPLDVVLAGMSAPEFLPDEKIGEDVCYRVQAKGPDGEMVFWIDRQSLVVRRFEYPVAGFLKALQEQDARIEKATLVAEYTGARINQPIDPRAFQFEAPSDLKQVPQFEPAAAELPPEKATIAPRSQPEVLKLTELWTSTEVERPGNVLALHDGRILLLDGFSRVAELSPAGNLVAVHPLGLPTEPAEAVVTYLRSAVDGQGNRYFVGCGSAQQQLHLFDAKFARLLSFPEGDHAGISDVQLGDLNGDGALEMAVGYWGVVGVQGVQLDGTRQWSLRTLENVTRLAITDANPAGQRTVVCASIAGTLTPIDHAGRQGRTIAVGTRFIESLVGINLQGDVAGPLQWCGLARTMRPGEYSAVGFDLSGTELWSYPLPIGIQHRLELEPVTGGPVVAGDDAGHWVLAGADGSIHIVSAEGRLVDRFAIGEPIAGLAVAQIDGQGALIVATVKQVSALRLQRE